MFMAKVLLQTAAVALFQSRRPEKPISPSLEPFMQFASRNSVRIRTRLVYQLPEECLFDQHHRLRGEALGAGG
jgi:hypothetical protein